MEGFTDHDLLVTAVTEIRDMRSDIRSIKEHQARTNGAVAEIKAEQYEARGREVMLRWLMQTGIAVAALVLTGTGIIVAVVLANGGI